MFGSVGVVGEYLSFLGVGGGMMPFSSSIEIPRVFVEKTHS